MFLVVKVAAMLAAQKNAENGIFPDTAPAADSEADGASGKVEVCLCFAVSSWAKSCH